MSALGHYLEDEGLATTIVSLVRRHSELVKPPRSLWVPFELGRPLGPPNNPALQRRVLEAALGLLESENEPSLLVDFDHDGDGTEPDDSWSPPLAAANAINLAEENDAQRLLDDEIARLESIYDRAKAARGRTTVGVAKLSMTEIAEHITSFLGGPHQDSPRADLSAAMVLRFSADDLKAYYMEAAAENGRPSSRQLGNWFWRETVAGQILIALRAAALESEDKRFRTVGSSFLVPRIWLVELGL